MISPVKNHICGHVYDHETLQKILKFNKNTRYVTDLVLKKEINDKKKKLFISKLKYLQLILIVGVQLWDAVTKNLLQLIMSFLTWSQKDIYKKIRNKEFHYYYY